MDTHARGYEQRALVGFPCGSGQGFFALLAELAYYALPFDSTPPRLTPAGSVANRLESLNKVLRAYADMDLAKVKSVLLQQSLIEGPSGRTADH